MESNYYQGCLKLSICTHRTMICILTSHEFESSNQESFEEEEIFALLKKVDAKIINQISLFRFEILIVLKIKLIAYYHLLIHSTNISCSLCTQNKTFPIYLAPLLQQFLSNCKRSFLKS